MYECITKFSTVNQSWTIPIEMPENILPVLKKWAVNNRSLRVLHNRRLCNIWRERMVEVCLYNTYICIVCAINNHQMDNLEGMSRKDKYPDWTSHYGFPYPDHFVATSTDDQVDLPLQVPKSMSLLIVCDSVVRVSNSSSWCVAMLTVSLNL